MEKERFFIVYVYRGFSADATNLISHLLGEPKPMYSLQEARKDYKYWDSWEMERIQLLNKPSITNLLV